jgi:hypothetical protein
MYLHRFGLSRHRWTGLPTNASGMKCVKGDCLVVTPCRGVKEVTWRMLEAGVQIKVRPGGDMLFASDYVACCRKGESVTRRKCRLLSLYPIGLT